MCLPRESLCSSRITLIGHPPTTERTGAFPSPYPLFCLRLFRIFSVSYFNNQEEFKYSRHFHCLESK